MPLHLLLSWWNLVYMLPFGLALVYLGLFVFTGITFGDVDADADMDADVDADAPVSVEAHVVDVDADVDADADADMDADADADHDTEVSSAALAHAHAHGGPLGHSLDLHSQEAGGHGSPMFSFLTLLGIGKIPISLALMICMFSWGVVGFALNSLLYQWLGASVLIPVISLPLAVVLTLTITGLCAAAVGKIIPNDDGTRERRQDLVGKAGEAIYDIDAAFGMAAVRGTAGDLFQVPCRTAEGTSKIAKGTRVVLFDYDREKGVFHVAPFDA